MFKNRDWFVLGAVGAVALLLAYWGFSGCVGANCTPEPSWKIFEKSLHLVQGRGSFSIGTDPWQLVVAQYLVPGVAVLAAAKLFLLSLRRDLRVAFARKSSNHTVVCGLSETGLHIVENLRNAGERVVAIDLDSETPAAASCAHAGVPVLKGDASDGKILRLAGAHRAKAIVATTGSDSTNLEISLRANDLGNTRRLVALPELRASWLRNAIANHQRAALGSANVEVRPFNISDNCARLLYRSPALARRRNSFAFAPPRILLLGFGETGEAIVEQGLRTAFAVPSELPEFLVVDEHASDRLSSCETRLPGLLQVAAVRCIDQALSPDPHSWAALNDLVVRKLPDLLASVGIEVRRERALPAVDSRGIELATERLQARTGQTQGEHLVIVLDPLLEASRKVMAMAQSAEDTSIWLLLREKMLATLAHAPENETATNVEGWLSEKEFAAMTNAPPHAADGEPHERAAQPEATPV